MFAHYRPIIIGIRCTQPMVCQVLLLLSTVRSCRGIIKCKFHGGLWDALFFRSGCNNFKTLRPANAALKIMVIILKLYSVNIRFFLLYSFLLNFQDVLVINWRSHSFLSLINIRIECQNLLKRAKISMHTKFEQSCRTFMLVVHNKLMAI